MSPGSSTPVEKLAIRVCIHSGKHARRRRFLAHVGSSTVVEKLVAGSLSILAPPLVEGPSIFFSPPS
jgi:hypothetical protein